MEVKGISISSLSLKAKSKLAWTVVIDFFQEKRAKLALVIFWIFFPLTVLATVSFWIWLLI